jgi:hypothetical protein
VCFTSSLLSIAGWTSLRPSLNCQSSLQELRELSAPTAELLPLMARMPALMTALSEAFRARIASLEEVFFSSSPLFFFC